MWWKRVTVIINHRKMANVLYCHSHWNKNSLSYTALAMSKAKHERMLSSTFSIVQILLMRSPVRSHWFGKWGHESAIFRGHTNFYMKSIAFALAWLVIRTRGRFFGVPSEQEAIFTNNSGCEGTSPSQFTLRSRVHVLQEFCLLQQICGFSLLMMTDKTKTQ